ncbi:hypothetical protein GJ496_003443 [Pomphorhynchus laevis]|nr:hypothetical protein GJ496_003443 [Pomphorhynchus laevis]
MSGTNLAQFLYGLQLNRSTHILSHLHKYKNNQYPLSLHLSCRLDFLAVLSSIYYIQEGIISWETNEDILKSEKIKSLSDNYLNITIDLPQSNLYICSLDIDSFRVYLDIILLANIPSNLNIIKTIGRSVQIGFDCELIKFILQRDSIVWYKDDKIIPSEQQSLTCVLVKSNLTISDSGNYSVAIASTKQFDYLTRSRFQFDSVEQHNRQLVLSSYKITVVERTPQYLLIFAVILLTFCVLNIIYFSTWYYTLLVKIRS